MSSVSKLCSLEMRKEGKIGDGFQDEVTLELTCKRKKKDDKMKNNKKLQGPLDFFSSGKKVF